MKFIDSHTHIDFPEFEDDRHETLARAKLAGVTDIIISATTAKRWEGITDFVNHQKEQSPTTLIQPQCHATAGLHPLFIKEHDYSHLNTLKNHLETNNLIAIAEIGLDFFMSNPNKNKQLEFFVAQLKIASEFDLPVIIHARKSLDIVLKNIRKIPKIRGSIHSFSGSPQQAEQLIDLGFYLGFGGPITYTRATRLRKLVSTLPLESILIETDSPDQPDASHHGERNEPAFLPIVAQTIAELRNTTIQEVAKITSQNAQTLFNFDLHP